MTGIRKTHIHIEPSSRCTLACPECPRTTNKGEYEITDCDIDLMSKACHGFETVIMCGNHGDPIYHPRLHELIVGIRSMNPSVSFVIVTNGAFRSQEWWEGLSSLLTSTDTVVFSIDGMPSNNHLYRINSRWDTVEIAIKTLRNKSNAHLSWKWILFEYNQSQIPDGLALAYSLGFDSFTVVHSARYGMNDWLIPDMSPEDLEEEINRWARSHQDAS